MIDNFAELEITASFGGNTGTKTGVFEMVGGEQARAEISHEIRTDFLLDSAGGTLLSVLSEFLDEGNADRKGFHFDVGTGEHAISITWDNTTGITDQDGTPPQWGSSPDPDVRTAYSATGGSATHQAQVFMNYIRHGEVDSRNPARLRVGEHHPGGILDELEVVIENPAVTMRNDRPSAAEGSITLLETQTIDETIDALERMDYG